MSDLDLITRAEAADDWYPLLYEKPACQVLDELGMPATERAVVALFSGQGPGWVYFIEAVGSERIKIGWSVKHPEDRARDMRTGSPFPLRALLGIRGTMKVERWLHRYWKEYRLHGEWFAADPIRAFIADIEERAP